MALFGWHTMILVAILAIPVAVAVFFVRRSRRAAAAGDPAPVVGVTLTISAFWAALSVVGACIAVISTLTAEQVQITIPVQEFWPQLPVGTELDGTSAHLVSGGFTSAEVWLSGLSVGARVCWAIAQGLGWLVPGAVAAMIAVACFQLLAGRTFAPVVARMAMVTAVVVLVGGIAAQVLGDIGGSMAASELLGWTGATYPDVAGVESALDAWVPKPGVGIQFPFWPIGAGLAFAALAAVFRYGSRLQRDTEGLV